jgi:hypothetical protein
MCNYQIFRWYYNTIVNANNPNLGPNFRLILACKKTCYFEGKIWYGYKPNYTNYLLYPYNKTNYMHWFSQILFWNEILHASDNSFVHNQEFITVHTAMVYVIKVCRQLSSRRIRMELCSIMILLLESCLYSIYHVCTVRNSWWWTKKLSCHQKQQSWPILFPVQDNEREGRLPLQMQGPPNSDSYMSIKSARHSLRLFVW